MSPITLLSTLIGIGVPNSTHWSWRWMVAPGPVILSLLLAYNASSIDLMIRPIVTDFVIDDKASYESKGFLHLEGNLTVHRKKGENRCEFSSVIVKDQVGNKLPLWFLNSINQGGSTTNGETHDREEGTQPWGPWTARLSLVVPTVYTSGAAYHECRQVWPFDTPNAEWSNFTWKSPSTWMPQRVYMERRISFWVARTNLWNRNNVSSIEHKDGAR